MTNRFDLSDLLGPEVGTSQPLYQRAAEGPSAVSATLSPEPSESPVSGPLIVPEIVHESTLADLMGITAKRVRELVRNGTIKRDGPARFNLRDSVRAYTASLREHAARAGRPGAAENDALRAEKLKLTAAQREAQEMKNAVIRGDLVPADEVSRGWASILTDVRAGMLAVPSRLPDLTPEQRAKLDTELRLALERLSNG